MTIDSKRGTLAGTRDYRARCKVCGWQGPWRAFPLAAQDDLGAHTCEAS